MVNNIASIAGQELAQIARKKRGPFQRTHEAQAEATHKNHRKSSSSKHVAQGNASVHDAVANSKAKKSKKPKHPHAYQSVVQQVQTPSLGQSSNLIKSGASPQLIALQDVGREARSVAEREAANRGLANARDRANVPEHATAAPHNAADAPAPESKAPEQAPPSVKVARPDAERDIDSFIKRYQHRDFNAEAALNLLSEGREQARDTSLSVKFQAYEDASAKEPHTRGFVQQFLDGAEKV